MPGARGLLCAELNWKLSRFEWMNMPTPAARGHELAVELVVSSARRRTPDEEIRCGEFPNGRRHRNDCRTDDCDPDLARSHQPRREEGNDKVRAERNCPSSNGLGQSEVC